MKLREEVLRDIHHATHQISIEAARKSEAADLTYIDVYETVINFLVDIHKKYQPELEE